MIEPLVSSQWFVKMKVRVWDRTVGLTVSRGHLNTTYSHRYHGAIPPTFFLEYSSVTETMTAPATPLEHGRPSGGSGE